MYMWDAAHCVYVVSMRRHHTYRELRLCMDAWRQQTRAAQHAQRVYEYMEHYRLGLVGERAKQAASFHADMRIRAQKRHSGLSI